MCVNGAAGCVWKPNPPFQMYLTLYSSRARLGYYVHRAQVYPHLSRCGDGGVIQFDAHSVGRGVSLCF